MGHLITPEALHDLLAGGTPVRVLDVRWRLDRPEGRPDYLEGHLPGAVYVDLDHELATRGGPDQGRHPLPSREDLQRAARRWGLNEGDTVIVYDDVKSVAAARAWWLLRRAGVAVRVLDGGLRAWIDAGYPLETGNVVVPQGEVVLRDAVGDTLTIDEAAEFPDRGVLLDVRAPERYRGDVETLDPIAGHIPGAVNLPTLVHVAPDGRLNRSDALRAAFAEVGVAPGTPVAAYCGSGITAAHTALALEEAGIGALVFPGSWSQWSNTRGRPVAIGILPRGNVVPA